MCRVSGLRYSLRMVRSLMARVATSVKVCLRRKVAMPGVILHKLPILVGRSAAHGQHTTVIVHGM